MSKKDFIITGVIVLLCVALITIIIVAKKNDAKNNPTTPSSSVAHDHNGDGVPDHDDNYHATEEDTDVDIGLDIEDLPSESGNSNDATGSTGGTGSGAVSGGEIEFEDLLGAGGSN